MRSNPKPQEIYKHFKGNSYQIVTLAEHSETGEVMVIYQALYGDFKMYARPVNIFMERMDKEKYPDIRQEYRFELQSHGMEQKSAGQKEEEQNIAEQKEEEAFCEGERIDPLVMEFLEADTHEERLRILTRIHHRITNDMINIMAIAIDVEIAEGDPEERFEELRHFLLTMNRYEINR